MSPVQKSNDDIFEVSLQSNEMAVRDALKQVHAGLRHFGLDIEEASTVELVLAEVLNNVVEHAYPEAEGKGPIRVLCQHRRDGLIVCVRDWGAAMPDGHLPLGEMKSLDVHFDDMPEGGFGWFMIHHLARDLQYERVGDQNHLKMRLAVGLTS